MANINKVAIGTNTYDIEDATARSLVSEGNTFTVTYSGGTVGTRGFQSSQNIEKSGYTPISAVITYVGSSTSYNPVAFLGSSDTLVYCNAYRCTTSAVSNSSIRIRVTYAPNDLFA